MSSTLGSSSSDPERANGLEHLFDAIGEALYVGLLSDGPDCDVTLAVNPHLKRLLGYQVTTPDHEVVPFDPARFADPDSRGAFLTSLARDGVVTGQRLLMRRPDHSEVWVSVTARAERVRGAWLHVQALIRPASPPGAVDAAPLTADIAEERLASLGLGICAVAHELNNPLATIVSWSEQLLDRPLDAATRRSVETIMGEAHRAARIGRTLLSFGRNRPSTRALVDVNGVVRETLALRSREQHLLHITVATNLATGLPEILADSAQIQQVLLNLMINAEHAMASAHGRGTLTVRTSLSAGGDLVIVEVRDDGPGLETEVKARIFDPFFTTKKADEGTGLGLSVVQAIVREHGGSMRVDSEPGRGSSFFVHLPVWQAPAASLQGLAALLVENERELASAVIESLSDAGMTVDYAGDGEEALARVRQRAYDLVICDLQMPRVNGMMFYRAIAAATPALARRVIFVTGEVAGTDAARFLEESGCRSVAKPFRFAELLRAVRDTLA